jgi:hypothetical protein
MKQEDEQGNSFFTEKKINGLRKRKIYLLFYLKINKKLGSIKYHYYSPNKDHVYTFSVYKEAFHYSQEVKNYLLFNLTTFLKKKKLI